MRDFIFKFLYNGETSVMVVLLNALIKFATLTPASTIIFSTSFRSSVFCLAFHFSILMALDLYICFTKTCDGYRWTQSTSVHILFSHGLVAINMPCTIRFFCMLYKNKHVCFGWTFSFIRLKSELPDPKTEKFIQPISVALLQ